MFAVRSLFKANTQILKNVAQHRNMSVIATPARNKITKGVSTFAYFVAKPATICPLLHIIILLK